MSNPTPEQIRDAIDGALNDTFGFHGPWVLAVECTDDDTGQIQAAVMGSEEGTARSRLGLAHMLVADITAATQQEVDDD